MTNLMRKYGYCGWYIGIMADNDYDNRDKETPEFGPYSKQKAKRMASLFNKRSKTIQMLKGLYAVAISGREALSWTSRLAERKAGWNPNP